ncbi:hypothetical protein GDO78_017317 [Eleutherodactylus coqui]|uniref:Uncharacterized protein n=1 Tax=Eleutherodactylus coqui TaxID=57060 RepID=A0A8J6C7Y5_ELECQ|nr:hypothetical protein GDO78_017317 [Eleutherodactylus coqui]
MKRRGTKPELLCDPKNPVAILLSLGSLCGLEHFLQLGLYSKVTRKQLSDSEISTWDRLWSRVYTSPAVHPRGSHRFRLAQDLPDFTSVEKRSLFSFSALKVVCWGAHNS